MLFQTPQGSCKPTSWQTGATHHVLPLQVSPQLEINYVLSALITASAFSSHPPETHNLTHLGLLFASHAPSLKSPLPASSGFHRYEGLSIHENSVSTEVPTCEEPPLTPWGRGVSAPLHNTAPEGIPCLSLSWQRREDGGQVFLVWTPSTQQRENTDTTGNSIYAG